MSFVEQNKESPVVISQKKGGRESPLYIFYKASLYKVRLVRACGVRASVRASASKSYCQRALDPATQLRAKNRAIVIQRASTGAPRRVLAYSVEKLDPGEHP